MTYTQVFDADREASPKCNGGENRLVSMTASGQTIQFLYDGDGNLVKQVYPDGSKTLYVGGGYEIDKNSGGSITSWMRYYPVAGAMRVNSTPYYVLKDHLGSASVVTNNSGATVGEQRFNPYGETRLWSGNMYTDVLFTGQREITNWKVYHYGARFYSPKLGRFLSADTIVPGASNPQAWNRYSYVLGNPLVYTDPTGHGQACEDGDVCWSPDTTPAPKSKKPKDEDDDPDPNPKGLSGTGGGGKPLYMPDLLPNGSCGDDIIGCEINYDVGVVIIHYNGVYKVITLELIKDDPVALLALTQFISNANERVSALDDIASAQRALALGTLETLVGGAVFAPSAAATIMSGGTLTFATGVGLLGGFALMADGGGRVYDAGMAWGNAADANRLANTNISAAWQYLSVLP